MVAERDGVLTGSPDESADKAYAVDEGTHGGRTDRGSVTLYVLIFSFAAFMLASLLVDGGTAISARERAADIAEQAARAAADDISISSLRSGNGQPQIDWGTACGRAASLVTAYQTSGDMHAMMARGGCSPGAAGGAQGAPGGAQAVSVIVTVTAKPMIPGFFPSFTETASATAEPECGITQGLPC